MNDPSIFIAAIVAFASCLALVPLAMKFAHGIGMVDNPDKNRKLHKKPIPLAGGLAIYAALPIALLATGGIAMTLGYAEWFRLGNFLPFIFGGTVLLAIGIIDDRFGMSGKTKLLGQVLSITLFLLFGSGDYEISLLGWQLPLWMSIPLIYVWMIGTINAVNLIDGADGVASTVGTVASIGLVVIGLTTGSFAEATLAAGLAGAIVAFLCYNFPPAKTFLGDTGSMLIGFLVGSIAINCSSKAASLLMVAPIAVVVIPLFDSFVAILRRRLTGRSIYSVDRGHIHHALMANGYGPRQMLAVVACLSIVGAVGGCLSAVLNNSAPAIVTVSLVLGYLVIGRVFGFAEFSLLKNRLLAIGSSFVTAPVGDESRPHERTIHLQGSRNWGQLWQAITEFAERHQMAQVRLDLNLPWLHEGYHATWQRPVRFDKQECWKTSLPLTANGRTFGRLEIVGPLTRSSVYTLLSLLSELLESMEGVILRLANEEHQGGRSEIGPVRTVPRTRACRRG